MTRLALMGFTGTVALAPSSPRHRVIWDRYEIIIAAYEALEPGAELELAVDHDPTCMYYTLKATRGDDAFAFHYLDGGPEVWRVRVRKIRDVPSRE